MHLTLTVCLLFLTVQAVVLGDKDGDLAELKDELGRVKEELAAVHSGLDHQSALQNKVNYLQVFLKRYWQIRDNAFCLMRQ